VIAKRARESDVAGWHGPALGLLIGGISEFDASALVEEIECSFRKLAQPHSAHGGALPDLACEIYSYPSREVSSKSPDASESVARQTIPKRVHTSSSGSQPLDVTPEEEM
jgi:hypothetical protein